MLDGGAPVAGARVELVAANRTRANIASLDAGSFYRSIPIVDLPAAHQETRTDATGRFFLGDWSDVSGEQYLTVRSADGALRVSRKLERSNSELKIDLAAGASVSPEVLEERVSRKP